jgi:hypothetical protein
MTKIQNSKPVYDLEERFIWNLVLGIWDFTRFLRQVKSQLRQQPENASKLSLCRKARNFLPFPEWDNRFNTIDIQK